jgi:uncharacterized protein YutE (UPF0331/DUF86 family)
MAEATEADVTQRLVSELAAQGYEVLVQPNKLATPEFLGSYRPDLIARRGDKNLIIEIKRRVPGVSQKLEEIAKRVENFPNWEFRIIWIDPSTSAGAEPLPVQEPDMIRKRLTEVRDLIVKKHNETALLLAWGVFEAVARALLPKEFGRAQTPGRILEILAADGSLTPTEADSLRRLSSKRNEFLHGKLGIQVSRKELTEMILSIENLIEQISSSTPVAQL